MGGVLKKDTSRADRNRAQQARRQEKKDAIRDSYEGDSPTNIEVNESNVKPKDEGRRSFFAFQKDFRAEGQSLLARARRRRRGQSNILTAQNVIRSSGKTLGS